MATLFYVLLFILGACLGSFLCCQARRLHLKETATRKGKKSSLGSRSVCLHCHHQLKWYDNIPILSWLFLRGKCRKCHHQIGLAEIVSEVALAVGFLTLGATIDPSAADPLTWSIFVSTLLLTTSLAFLAIYDGLYGELPTKYLIISILLAIINLSLQHAQILITAGFSPELIYQPLLAVLILGGLYLTLYLFSHGKWVGDGDWLVATAIGIALGHPWLALIALFVANLLACLFALPHLKKTKKIYLGPFLVVSFVIVYSLSNALISLIS
ncbi:MAG: prepilin peptidase [Candidatus Saccharibacteria bacterium]|nr:prepilin peptidase [Candidatus Saccharibacteria bacterium]